VLPGGGARPIFAAPLPPAPDGAVNPPARVAVLASGGGSNLQALLDRFRGADAPARVALVVASRAGIGALDRAERAGVPALVLDPRALGPDAFRERLLAGLEGAGIDLVALAGWLQLLPPEVVERYRGRMLNVHPALLPAFGGTGMYGIRVHRAVIEAGVRVSGATVHMVDVDYDSGAILAQWPVPVLPGDTPERLAARVLAVEHRILPLAVEALARGERTAEDGEAPVAFDLVNAPVPAERSVLRTLRPAD
jgi:phosphoribosylglycinamide formyltransferase 1